MTRTQALQSAQQPQPQSPSPNSSSSSGPDANKSLPSELVQQLGPGYTSGSLPVHYINSAWLCEQPSAACTAVPNTSGQSVCLLQGYTRINPDVVGAAGDPNAGGYNYGVQVVLPAVLVSVRKSTGLRGEGMCLCLCVFWGGGCFRRGALAGCVCSSGYCLVEWKEIVNMLGEQSSLNIVVNALSWCFPSLQHLTNADPL